MAPLAFVLLSTTHVVRGIDSGEDFRESLLLNIRVTMRSEKLCGASVVVGDDADDVPWRRLRRWDSVYLSSVERLRAAGFELKQTGSDPHHYNVLLPDTEPRTLERLMAAFDGPYLKDVACDLLAPTGGEQDSAR